MIDITRTYSGRVTRIELDDPETVENISITKLPDNGYLTVDPDKSALIYVSTDPGFSGKLDMAWDIARKDGPSESADHILDLELSPHQKGWGTGSQHYMLRTDENDDVIVETGEFHRKVYVTGSEDGITQADIEEREGIKIEGKIGDWLESNPEYGYGASEDMALAADVGRALWQSLNPGGWSQTPRSDWFLMERGYEYDFSRIINRGVGGEDELHPMHITSWGEGERPKITEFVVIFQDLSENIAFTDIDFNEGMMVYDTANILFENVRSNGNANLQGSDGMTLRKSEYIDGFKDEPLYDEWHPHVDRESGVYTAGIDGLLIEDTLIDHGGWEEGFSIDNAADYGQPPSMFSHNVYMQYTTYDVTFRDNVSMRGASFGTQFRGGALVEDNMFLDNNIAFNLIGGRDIEDSDVKRDGNFSLANGNIVTSAGHKEADAIGSLSGGIDDASYLATILDNVVTHLANPDDQAERIAKWWSHPSLTENENRFYNDTIVHNWTSSKQNFSTFRDANKEGLDEKILNETTIQRYAAELLGQETASIDDLAEYWRNLTNDGGEINVEHMVDYFQEAFGVNILDRVDARTVTFIPNELADGVRWDNRLNWDSGDVAGSVAGDNVDLNGSMVFYGGTHEIQSLDFGVTGTLDLNHGYLGVDTIVDGGNLEISRAGQFWVDGTNGVGTLDLNIDGGRFVNAGIFDGSIDIDATNGETVLATANGLMSVTLGRISVTGPQAKVGFDGPSGSAAFVMTAGSTLRIGAEEGKLGQIREFRTGAFETSDVTSLVNLEGATVEVDLAGVTELGEQQIINVDVLTGVPESFSLLNLGTRDAVIVVDRVTDGITVQLSAGTGQTSIEINEQDAEETWIEDALWKDVLTLAAGENSQIKPDPAPEPEPHPHPQPQAEPQPGQIYDPNFGSIMDRVNFEAFTPEDATSTDRNVIETPFARSIFKGRVGDDFILAADGNEFTSAHTGDDMVFKFDGADIIVSKSGDNDSGTGNDRILGAPGDDIRSVGNGDDILGGGPGSDVLDSGKGVDKFVFDITDLDNTGHSTVFYFSSKDRDQLDVTGIEDGTDLYLDTSNKGFVEFHVREGGDTHHIATAYGSDVSSNYDIDHTGEYITFG